MPIAIPCLSLNTVYNRIAVLYILDDKYHKWDATLELSSLFTYVRLYAGGKHSSIHFTVTMSF
jgi:hypothetical protein